MHTIALMSTMFDREIEEGAKARLQLIRAMRPSELVKEWARHLNFCSNAQDAMAEEWLSRPMREEKDSQQEELELIIEELLGSKVQLEIVFSAKRGVWHGRVYPFGQEKPRFAFSFECLMFDPELLTIATRFVSPGADHKGMTLFRKYDMTPDKTKQTFTDFAQNETLSSAIDRSIWLSSYLRRLVAQIEVAATSGQSPALRATACTVLARCLSDVHSRMAQRFHVSDDQPRRRLWVTEQLLDDVQKLVDICSSLENFTIVNIAKLNMEFIHRAGRAL